jgi:oligopeptidase A
MLENPLLEIEFRIPFDEIRPEHVQPAVQSLLEQSQQGVDRISSAPAPRTFKNTLEVLDAVTEGLEYAMSIVRHLEGVVTTPELRQAYNAVQPAVSAFYSSLPLNQALWQAVQAYAATPEAQQLTGTRQRYLKKTIDSFRRHGAELDPEGKKRLSAIDVELSQLTTKFSENVLDSTNAFELVIDDEALLAGLPESAIAAARASAESKGLPAPAWRFSMQAPSYLAVMTYLDDRKIRERMYHASVRRATEEGRDNRPLMRRILELRREKANLLGYPDFSDLVLEDRMAHTGARAQGFLEELRIRTEPFFQRENAELRRFATTDRLQPWDIAYWAEKQRLAQYDFDEEKLRPYFPLEQVVKGMFSIVERLYGIRVTRREGVPVWDPAVTYYEIHDEGNTELLGAFYADWFPRENKRGGAWMDIFITGVDSGGHLTPHAGLICGNLTPPVGDKPALLTHRDVQTIFHEFGHLLHQCLSRVEIRSLAGANVAWDFVELPSQIMENWTWEREALDLFARHYQTGEPIPRELFEKMVNARNFRAANGQMRQLGLGYTDLALHREWKPDHDPIQFARDLMQQFSPAPLAQDHAMFASFTHLFGSPVGYGAGYYSYKWAEVLDADAFTQFHRRGVFSRDVGERFRNSILARGDSQDPAQLYRDFMGRDPDPEALLVRSGLIQNRDREKIAGAQSS